MPIAQTPGRLQYYKSPNAMYLSDEIKWGLRTPLRFAVSEETVHYKDESEQKVLAFVREKFQTDLMGDGEEFNLDMTIEECEFLTLASDDVKAKA